MSSRYPTPYTLGWIYHFRYSDTDGAVSRIFTGFKLSEKEKSTLLTFLTRGFKL